MKSGGVNLSEGSELILGTGIDNVGSLDYTNGGIYGKMTRWVNNAATGVLFPVGVTLYRHVPCTQPTNSSSCFVRLPAA